MRRLITMAWVSAGTATGSAATSAIFQPRSCSVISAAPLRACTPWSLVVVISEHDSKTAVVEDQWRDSVIIGSADHFQQDYLVITCCDRRAYPAVEPGCCMCEENSRGLAGKPGEPGEAITGLRRKLT